MKLSQIFRDVNQTMQTVFAFFNMLKRVQMPQVPARDFLFISNGFTSKWLNALGLLYFRIQMSIDVPNNKKINKALIASKNIFKTHFGVI